MEKIDKTAMSDLIQSIANLQLSVIKVHVGYAQNLFVTLGRSESRNQNLRCASDLAPRVELHTQFSDWKLQLDKSELLSSFQRRNIKDEAEALLIGRGLRTWDFDVNTAALKLIFDTDISLEVEPYKSAKDRNNVAWSLQTCDDWFHTAKCGGEYSIIGGNEVPE